MTLAGINRETALLNGFKQRHPLFVDSGELICLELLP